MRYLVRVYALTTASLARLTWQSVVISASGVVCVAVTGRKRRESYIRIFRQLLPVAVALKFIVHVVQSFIKGHRKSGVISMKHSSN